MWLLLCATAWLLWPAMGGYFLFDDSWNLKGLSNVTANPGFATLSQYVLNGLSSTLGRPLALLTFGLQHASWPWHPADFIRVNILLHLLNGALLFWWLLRLLALMRPDGSNARRAVLALAITALWLWSLLQISAVVYVVQRMTVLSGTFVLAGLLLHAAGRAALVAGALWRGYVLMTAGVGVGAGLGTLAKEGAVLMPLMLIALEATLLQHLPRPGPWKHWTRMMLYAPLGLLAGYFLWRIPALADGFVNREFTLGQRLITEPRILFGYLSRLFVPFPATVQLHYDDLVVSSSLLQPVTTVLSLGAWLAAAASAIRWRATWPMAAFAVLWFLACHTLESTFLPLELAFDHRNYLASIGPLLALASGVDALLAHPRIRGVRAPLAAGAAAYLGLCAMAAGWSASIWGDPVQQAGYWASLQPESRRSVHLQAEMLGRVGRHRDALNVYAAAVERWPRDVSMAVSLLEMACYRPEVKLDQVLRRAHETLRHADNHPATSVNLLHRLMRYAEEGQCARLPPAELQALMAAALAAPHFEVQWHNLLILNSRAAEHARDRSTAFGYLDAAIQLNPRTVHLKQALIWSLQAGDVDSARAYLETAEHSPRLSALYRWSQRVEIARMREIFDDYVQRAGPPPPPPPPQAPD